MNIVLFTNTFTPHVGGVARSVQAFTDEYRRLGHRVLVVAPEFEDMPEDEVDVIRIRAIQNFNTSDFSVALPIPQALNQSLLDFNADIIHSQHPFLLGMTAVRAARSLNLPLIFTHHTLYEEYTHYVPGDSPLLRSFVIGLATHYANLSDQVIAPSESIRDLLLERGVHVPVEVIPTGVYVEKFANGSTHKIRQRYNIPSTAFVVGHMGRLATEKNMEFLASSVCQFLADKPESKFLVVGEGDAKPAIEKIFTDAGLQGQLAMTGVLEKEELADALNAMDVFAFASKSETQGMVLTEAMAAGLPVVALNASGTREVVRDTRNGRLLDEENEDTFAAALNWVYDMDPVETEKLITGARQTADEFSMAQSAKKALACFRQLHRQIAASAQEEEQFWEQMLARIKAEWNIIRSFAAAGEDAINDKQRNREP